MSLVMDMRLLRCITVTDLQRTGRYKLELGDSMYAIIQLLQSAKLVLWSASQLNTWSTSVLSNLDTAVQSIHQR